MEDNVSIAPTQTCTTTSHSHQLALATTIPEIPETAPGLLPTIPHLLIRPSSPPPSIVLFIHPSANHTAHIPIIGGLLRHQRRAATGLAAAASGTAPPHTTGKILAHFSVTSNLHPVFAFAHSLSVFPPLQLPNSPVLVQPVLLVMASTSLFRLATRTVRPASFVRAPQLSRVRVQQTPIALAINRPSFSTTSMRLSGAHEDETYEEFSSRYAAAHHYFWE